MRAACLTHLILIDFINLIIFGEEWLQIMPLFTMQFSMAPFLLPRSQTPLFDVISLGWETNFYTHTKFMEVQSHIF
jgi:hypothetical protein